MTNKELKNKIVEATDVEWFKNVQETFTFPYINFIQSLTGVSAIYEFVNQQLNGWGKIEEPIPSELALSIAYFQDIKDLIINFVNNHLSKEKDYLDVYWSEVKNRINTTNQTPLPFNFPQTEFLLKVYRETPNYFSGAFNSIFESHRFNTNNRESLFGAILAYEFILKDKTGITKRIDTEQKSIARLKNDFQKYLSESEHTIVEHIKKTSTYFWEYASQMDELKKEKESIFSDWFNKMKLEDWEKWYDEKKEKIKKLEDTYETKLKLEKPARYWQTKSTIYYKQGVTARNAILAIVSFVSIFLAIILIASPDWIFKNVFKDNSIAIVRWSIVFLILISLIAYTIKALTKYMFSSFHLARDAEERHTLTFFYLALTKDTEVKDDDRKLILQSLFSRSDTGLLKEDSSPTMPSDAISRLVTK